VKVFLDTSVLVATFYGDHQNHESSAELFLSYGPDEACCAAHSLAEVYASLTSMPGKYRTSADEALLFLDNIRERLSIVTLSKDGYFKALESSAAAGVAGGSIYDALLAHCALKAGVEKIYTWNIKHFKRLGAEIAKLVTTP
jgi:predicted nucleic acid-binding protein